MDARWENMIINPETRQLAALEPNKRQRFQDTSKKTKAVSRPSSVRSQLEPGFLHDIAGVSGVFM
ncbi:unnamed protein product [Clonostachys rhizophaga]|uniref:Uncharacterized protein n=1 Tax=Clonostachys rhizophaga TaxID=160324 RepID=A0A9N9VMN8_9HYPO|nr:unnamed protein product [Clonostachys rhizophaga]